MAFPRERDPGTGTKNEVVTNWQHSVMRIQVNKNPSMTAQQLHNKCVSLQNLSIRTIQRCLTVLLHKKHRFLLFGAYCTLLSVHRMLLMVCFNLVVKNEKVTNAYNDSIVCIPFISYVYCVIQGKDLSTLEMETGSLRKE